MASCNSFVILLVLGLIDVCSSQLELDERFLEYRKQGMWLVEFYAPWCGYCKKLEPIYKEVASELQQAESPVHVAKLDCTKYSNVASEFTIRGFPTIMFIQGDRIFTHRGDRTKEDIVEFALRAQGPTVRKLGSLWKFHEALKQHGDSVMFLYIGNNEEDSDLFKIYSLAAENFAIHSYFYSGDKQLIENVHMKRYPTVLAVKDARFYEYEPTDGTTTAVSLQQFVNRERYAMFPKMSGLSLNDLASVVKFLVIVAVEAHDLDDPSTASARLFQVVKQVAFDQREAFHSQFQFLWMDNTDTVNNIALSFLATPVFMVMETENRLYYLNPHAANSTVATLTKYLTSVAEGKEQAHGGTGLLMRLKGMLFELLFLVANVWTTSRWLFFLVFGLPAFIISMICYSLCCLETTDYVAEYDTEDEEEEEEKLDETSLPPVTPWVGELPPYGAVGDGSWQSNEEKKNK